MTGGAIEGVVRVALALVESGARRAVIKSEVVTDESVVLIA